MKAVNVENCQMDNHERIICAELTYGRLKEICNELGVTDDTVIIQKTFFTKSCGNTYKIQFSERGKAFEFPILILLEGQLGYCGIPNEPSSEVLVIK